MRAALWFIGLFGVACALALFASSNDGTVTIFWPPHRVDISLNLVVLLLLGAFVLFYAALRAIYALLALPKQAHHWRVAYHERAVQLGLLDTLIHLMSGRFSRARKSAELTLMRESSMRQLSAPKEASTRMRVVAHLLAAQSANALRDHAARDSHLAQALDLAEEDDSYGVKEAVMLRAAHWALSERDIHTARRWLDRLPGGVARRTVALRLRLKMARMDSNAPLALETTRLLAKHKAFSALQAHSLLRALVLECVASCQDVQALQTLWDSLDAAETEMSEVACQAASQYLHLGGDAATALSWLLPIWERMVGHAQALANEQKLQLIHALEISFSLAGCDTEWLARIEQAQKRWPAEVSLQYLAGVACLHTRLWGKAQQLIQQALPRLQDTDLQIRAWQAMAELAQALGDQDQAAQATQNASKLSLQRRQPAPPGSYAEGV